jgi:hypothetical protein
MPTEWPPQYAKDERQRLLAEWRRQGLGVDQIARRFRLEYNVGALTAYRWANDLTQLEVANAYSERFLGADERLFPSGSPSSRSGHASTGVGSRP